MSRDRVINAEDVIKALINNDSHWTDLLRKINFDERLKIVQDAVNMVLPDFVDCINKSIMTKTPSLALLGWFFAVLM